VSHCECDECSADFEARADMIAAALDGADGELEIDLLTMFTARALASWCADDRKSVQRDMLEAIDSETKDWVMAGCDA
jgi:hypothetical protein